MDSIAFFLHERASFLEGKMVMKTTMVNILNMTFFCTDFMVTKLTKNIFKLFDCHNYGLLNILTYVVMSKKRKGPL